MNEGGAVAEEEEEADVRGAEVITLEQTDTKWLLRLLAKEVRLEA